MKLNRIKKVNVKNDDRFQLGDQIKFKLKNGEQHSMTCIDIAENKALFCFDEYLDEEYPMNYNNSNEGGYDESDARKHLQEIAKLLPKKIRKRVVLFENGDVLRLPTMEEMFGFVYNEDYNQVKCADKQLGYFKSIKNRIATRKNNYECGWTATSLVASSTNFADVTSGGGSYDDNASGAYGLRPLVTLSMKTIVGTVCADNDESDISLTSEAQDAVGKGEADPRFRTIKEIAEKVVGSYDGVSFTLDTPSDVTDDNWEPVEWYGAKVINSFDGLSVIVGSYGLGVLHSLAVQEDETETVAEAIMDVVLRETNVTNIGDSYLLAVDVDEWS